MIQSILCRKEVVMKNNTKKLTLLAMMITFAIILSYIESKIPAFVAIPGVKIGLANIVVIFVLFKLGIKEAIVISGVRVFIISLLFGNPISLIYSIAGAFLSLTVMFILKKLTPLKEVALSVVGGVMHNVGQIAVASLILETNVLVYYLPFLILSGTIAGIAVGVAAALLIVKTKKLSFK